MRLGYVPNGFENGNVLAHILVYVALNLLWGESERGRSGPKCVRDLYRNMAQWY